jgi:thiol-disulfide isomerase/thioredoxin
MHRRILRFARVVLAVTAVLASAFVAVAEESEAPSADTPFIVKIHAEWCGTCTRMNPTFDELDAKLDGKARIVVLDVTDQDAVARSAQEADRLGLRTFFERYKSKTGTVGVLDGTTREPVTILKGETDTAPYVAAVAAATKG